MLFFNQPSDTICFMVNFYDYFWKHNGTPTDTNETSVRFTKPLKEGSMFADLRNGRTYNVVAVSQVKESSFKDTPKEMIQTSDAKSITDEQLTALRDSHKYPADPEWPYLILPEATLVTDESVFK
jgi:hypothetical protein